jgi:hypothetical protein
MVQHMIDSVLLFLFSCLDHLCSFGMLLSALV